MTHLEPRGGTAIETKQRLQNTSPVDRASTTSACQSGTTSPSHTLVVTLAGRKLHTDSWAELGDLKRVCENAEVDKM